MDFRITIDVKNVSGGDIDSLAEQILEAHGDEYDAAIGDFTVSVSQKVGGNFFGRDPGDDEIG